MNPRHGEVWLVDMGMAAKTRPGVVLIADNLNVPRSLIIHIATLKITGSLPQNVNYALKSSFITAFLETLPDVSPKLKSPRPNKARPLADIADEAKSSVTLVTVY